MNLILTSLNAVLGAFAITGQAGAETTAAPRQLHIASVASDSKVEKPSGHVPVDMFFAYRLHKIHSHLTAANILVSLGRYSEATFHSSAQAMHLYDDMTLELDRRKIAPFGRPLGELSDAVAERRRPEYITPLVVSLNDAIWSAYDTVPQSDRASLAFNLDLAVMLLYDVAREYAQSWNGLKLANLDKFQNAYGLLLEARRLLSQTLPRVRAMDAKKARKIEDAFLQLQRAFPSIDPPAKPVLPASTIRGLVAAIAVNARKARNESP